MQNKVNYTIVGLFVVLLTAVIVFMILYLGHAATGKNYEVYAVYMQEAVSGLNIQAPVKFNGVKVGEVIDISLDHQDLKTVTLLLHIESGIPITEATRAVLMAQGITGITYIGLKVEAVNSPLLKIHKGQKYRVIPSSPSVLLQLDSLFKEMNASFKLLTENLHYLLNEKNGELLQSNLKNMAKFTEMLAGNSQHMTVIMKNSEQLSRQLQSTLQEISLQTLPSATLVVEQFSQVLKNLEQITGEVKRQPAVLIRGKQTRELGPGE